MSKAQNIILADLNALKTMDKGDLNRLWVEYFGNVERPSSHNLIIYKIAWHIQQKACGGLPARTKTKLNRLISGRVKAPLKKYQLAPNTILKREWNNRTYIVNVLDKRRFEYDGREYTSLTTIVKVITGSHQSGPLFFGLYKDKRK